MSSLFRPSITTYQLPDGKHRTPDGKRVTKDTPAAVRTVRKSPIWWGKYKGADGSFIKTSLCRNKQAAKEMLDKLATDGAKSRVGLGDPFAETHREPLSKHLEDYRRYLMGEENSPEYIDKTCRAIRKVLHACRFVFIEDLAKEPIIDYLKGLRTDPAIPTLPPGQELFMPRELRDALGGSRPGQLSRILKREALPTVGNGKARRYPRETVLALQGRILRGIGTSTSNGYRVAMKSFSNWLFTNERTGQNRLAGLHEVEEKVRRHERRALVETELRMLLEATARSETSFDELTGADRRIIYALAMTTGFRASEIYSLSPASFDLARNEVKIEAAYTKNGKPAEQPLPADVAEDLRGYLAGKPRNKPLWPGTWNSRAAEMLRIDLAAASIPYRDEDGLVVDFHGLRHSFITLLSSSGISPKKAQELARHSDIRLTMQTYTHIGIAELASAIDGMPSLMRPDQDSERQALAATGTDGTDSRRRPRLDQTDDRSQLRLIADDHNCKNDTIPNLERNPMPMNAFDVERELVIAGESELPGKDSNLDKENQNLLCYRYTTG